MRRCKKCDEIYNGDCKSSKTCPDCKNRCQAINKSSNRRCAREALFGNYCCIHYKMRIP